MDKIDVVERERKNLRHDRERVGGRRAEFRTAGLIQACTGRARVVRREPLREGRQLDDGRRRLEGAERIDRPPNMTVRELPRELERSVRGEQPHDLGDRRGGMRLREEIVKSRRANPPEALRLTAQTISRRPATRSSSHAVVAVIVKGTEVTPLALKPRYYGAARSSTAATGPPSCRARPATSSARAPGA